MSSLAQVVAPTPATSDKAARTAWRAQLDALLSEAMGSCRLEREEGMPRKLCTSAIGLVLLATTAFAAEHTPAETQRAVTEFENSYTKLFNSKNTKGILELFANDGVEAAPGPLLTARTDVAKRFDAVFSSGANDLKLDVRQVQSAGDYVIAVGQFTSGNERTGRELHGNYVNIYEWEGDTLKFRVHSFNFNVPPPQ
jgi:ketosteroid isomerase-like protein